MMTCEQVRAFWSDGRTHTNAEILPVARHVKTCSSCLALHQQTAIDLMSDLEPWEIEEVVSRTNRRLARLAGDPELGI